MLPLRERWGRCAAYEPPAVEALLAASDTAPLGLDTIGRLAGRLGVDWVEENCPGIAQPRLLAAIVDQGDTVAGFAQRLRISTETLEKYLHGDAPIPTPIGVEMCRFLGRQSGALGFEVPPNTAFRKPLRRRTQAEILKLSQKVHGPAAGALVRLHIGIRQGIIDVPWPTRPPDHATMGQIEAEFRYAWTKAHRSGKRRHKRAQHQEENKG